MNLTQTDTTATIHLDDNRKMTLNFKGMKFTSRAEFFNYVYLKIFLYIMNNQFLKAEARNNVATEYANKIVDSKLYLIESEVKKDEE